MRSDAGIDHADLDVFSRIRIERRPARKQMPPAEWTGFRQFLEVNGLTRLRHGEDRGPELPRGLYAGQRRTPHVRIERNRHRAGIVGRAAGRHGRIRILQPAETNEHRCAGRGLAVRVLHGQLQLCASAGILLPRRGKRGCGGSQSGRIGFGGRARQLGLDDGIRRHLHSLGAQLVRIALDNQHAAQRTRRRGTLALRAPSRASADHVHHGEQHFLEPVAEHLGGIDARLVGRMQRQQLRNHEAVPRRSGALIGGSHTGGLSASFACHGDHSR
jgi:hypothetical protein